MSLGHSEAKRIHILELDLLSLSSLLLLSVTATNPSLDFFISIDSEASAPDSAYRRFYNP